MRLSGIGSLSFAVAEIGDAPSRPRQAIFFAVIFIPAPVWRVGVWRPVLWEAISLMAICAFLKIVAVPIGVGVGDDNSPVRKGSAIWCTLRFEGNESGADDRYKNRRS